MHCQCVGWQVKGTVCTSPIARPKQISTNSARHQPCHVVCHVVRATRHDWLSHPHPHTQATQDRDACQPSSHVRPSLHFNFNPLAMLPIMHQRLEGDRAPASPMECDAPASIQALVTKMMSIVLSFTLLTQSSPAGAVLNSPNANIARSADAALRRSIPANNPEVKDVQTDLEEIAYLLRIPQRKPFGTMANDVKDALAKFETQDRLLDGVPEANLPEGRQAVENLYASLKKLEVAVQSQQGDYIGLRVSEALKATADLELLQAPGLPFVLPRDYMSMTRLVGRAVVQLEVERGGELAFVDPINGGLTNKAKIQITLDGFSAPITSGRFLENVLSQHYDDRVVEASRTAVVAPSPSPSQAAPVPLEILPLGEFDPVYRIPLDVQSGELPVLPLSINGAVSFTHVPGNDSYLSGDDFFLYKFDKQQAGLGGLAFDEGTFAVFGYVTQGLDVMNSLKSGDRIIKAECVSGADKLIKPSLG